jgi:hypothetical protein
MMRTYIPAILLALGACSGQSSTQVLSSRISAGLDQTMPCNRPADIEFLQDGATIRFPETMLFLTGRTDLSPCGRYALASVIQAMLDPRIMQVVIEPQSSAAASPSEFALLRAATVQRTLSHVAFTQGQPPVLVQPALTPSPGLLGIVLSIRAA